jgi:hypothetical protein
MGVERFHHGLSRMVYGVLLVVFFSPFVEAEEVDSATDFGNILILGDSQMSGYFGRYLHKSLRKEYPGSSVFTVVACGRGSGGYMKQGKAHCGLKTIGYNGRSRIAKGCKKNPCTPKDGRKCERNACRIPSVDLLLEEHNPSVTIIQLGGNSWFLGSVKDGWVRLRPHVVGLADKVLSAGSRCVWVSPSDSMRRPKKKNLQFTAFLKEALQGKCEVFESMSMERNYLDYRALIKKTGLSSDDYDGVHYGWFGPAGRKVQRRWATEIVETVRSLPQ